MKKKTTLAGTALALVLAAVIIALVSQRANVNTEGLEFVDIGIDEDRSPVVLGITVKNPSAVPVSITKCRANVLWNYLIAGHFSKDNLPESFKYEVMFLGDTHVVLLPRESTTVYLTFHWRQEDAAPESVAACQAILTLDSDDGKSVDADPIAFVVTHGGGKMSVQQAGGFRIDASYESAKKFLDSINAVRGRKSERIQYLIEQMRKRLADSEPSDDDGRPGNSI